MWDTHHYEEPSFFLKSFNFWDNWQQETGNEDVTVLVGEYSVYQIDTPDGVVNYSNPADEHITYPRLISAIAESVYLLGAERNPNTVKMTCYAPSFENYNGDNWTPDCLYLRSSVPCPPELMFCSGTFQYRPRANFPQCQLVLSVSLCPL